MRMSGQKGFEGWYFKQQCGECAGALLPAEFCGRVGDESG